MNEFFEHVVRYALPFLSIQAGTTILSILSAIIGTGLLSNILYNHKKQSIRQINSDSKIQTQSTAEPLLDSSRRISLEQVSPTNTPAQESQCTTDATLATIGLVDPSTQQIVKISADELAEGPPDNFQNGCPPDLAFVQKRRDAVPTKIACRLVVTVEDSCNQSKLTDSDYKAETFKHKKLFSMPWQQPEAFKQCGTVVEDALRMKVDHVCQVYCNFRQFRILKVSPDPDSNSWDGRRKLERKDRQPTESLGEVEVSTESIDKDQEWGEQLQTRLAYHLSTDRSSIFLLEITYSYATLEPHAVRSCIRDECRKKIYSHLCKRKIHVRQQHPNWFLPGKYLDKYFSEEVIRHLVQNDDQIGMLIKKMKEKRAFIKYIRLWLVRSLACNILANASDLRCLYRLWRNGKGDVDILGSKVSSGVDADIDIDQLQNYMRHVMAHTFECPTFTNDDSWQGAALARSRPEDIPEDRVLPIIFVRTIDAGGFGRVDCVRIHPDHHGFSANRNEEYALKVITRDLTLLHGSFDTERRVLEELSKAPHPHLTPMLTSWSHSNACSILMPKAESDLEHFLWYVNPPAKFDTSFVTWLFCQVNGIADALKFFHNHVRAWHFDLRLKNILVFSGDVFKISDFGTAKLGAVTRSGHSRPTPRQLSDVGYQAPDLEREKKVSRPQDVWSLGCILLEIMVWAFNLNVAQFRRDRMEERTKADGEEYTPSFWCQRLRPDGSKVFELKKCVRDMIADLKEHEQITTGFQKLLETIEGMLRLQAHRQQNESENEVRYDMVKVVDNLGTISDQARLNLVLRPPMSTIDNGSFYSHRLHVPQGGRRRTNSCPSIPSQQEIISLSQQPSAPDPTRDLALPGSQFPIVDYLRGRSTIPSAIQQVRVEREPVLGFVFHPDHQTCSPIEGTNLAENVAYPFR